ncbi:MAG: sulfotransferase [Proteobacteria bacterium]|nr:sulfotransferase [Pseudomonadota bacterium]
MQFSRNLIHLYNQLSPKLPEILNSFLVSNPVFIVSTPRSGSTLLFEQLIRLDNIWSIGSESHVIFREFPHLRFENQQFDSACLSKHHADSQTSLLFKLAIYSMLINNRNQPLINMDAVHHKQGLFLEKTPRNALNIPFLLEIFPNAKFIYIYRDPFDVFNSACHLRRTMIEANTLGKSIFKDVENDIISIYKQAFDQYQNDKSLIPQGHLHELRYEDLAAEPVQEMEKIYEALNLSNVDGMRTEVEPQVEKLKNYKKNQFTPDPHWAKVVYDECRAAFELFGYAPPLDELTETENADELSNKCVADPELS